MKSHAAKYLLYEMIFNVHQCVRSLPGAGQQLARDKERERLAVKWLRTYVTERVPERRVALRRSNFG